MTPEELPATLRRRAKRLLTEGKPVDYEFMIAAAETIERLSAALAAREGEAAVAAALATIGSPRHG